MWTATGRFAFSWVLTKDSVACRHCRAAILMEKLSSFFCPFEFWQLCAPNTWIRSSEVGEANNQCPNIAECLLFHMSMAVASFAPLCCWWRVAGNCDFNVFGADDVASNAPLADCNGNHSWKICVFMDFENTTQWLAGIAGQRFWWKGGLRFFVH